MVQLGLWAGYVRRRRLGLCCGMCVAAEAVRVCVVGCLLMLVILSLESGTWRFGEVAVGSLQRRRGPVLLCAGGSQTSLSG